MLMMGNKEKAVGLILKGLSGKDAAPTAPVESPSNTQNDFDEGGKIAAQDLVNAIEAKDIGRIVSAFKALYEICEMSEEE
jgi:hypothetical protein